MKTKREWLVAALSAIATIAFVNTPRTFGGISTPPPTRTDPQVDTIFGVPVADPYRWLESQNSPETRSWIDAQNAYSRSLLDTISGREKLRHRYEELLKMDQEWLSTFKGNRFIFSKRKAEDPFSSYYLRDGLSGQDQLLLDPLTLSKDSSITPGILDISKDGKLMAYSLRKGGQDQIAIKFKNLDTKIDLPDSLPLDRYYGGLVFTADARAVYYAVSKSEGPRIFYHVLGSDASKDSLFFGESYGSTWNLGVETSPDGKYLLITGVKGSASDYTEIFIKDMTANGPLITVVKGVQARFDPALANDRMFVVTDWKAPNSRVLVADFANPGFENWKEIIPNGALPLQSITPANGMLIAKYLDSVISKLQVYSPEGKLVREIKTPTLGTVSGVIGRWDSDQQFMTFGSFNYPWTQLKYDTKSWESTVFEKVKIPLDPEQFVVKQVWYKSKDSTRVPMFIVHAKDLQLDGNRPVFMTGYGGFTVSEQPTFSQSAIIWMEHGGVYVMTNLRGGGEFGEPWHRAGMLAKKQNSFDDFIAAAQWLIANKYTNPKKIAIVGGSNGGLLVGAAVTQRPDLFGAVVCEYPLLDMIRFQRFLVAKYWVPEYGSSEDSTQFNFIRAYSPYQNVTKGTKFPAVLFETGDNDTRVDPLHARKMTALMQASTGSDKPILLLYATRAGHSGGRTLDSQIDDLVDIYSFLFWQLGVPI